MTATVDGLASWGLTRDKEGHRTYKARWQVRSNNYYDGPNTVANAAGLPVVGAGWAFGNESDPWARCWPTLAANPHGPSSERGYLWMVDQTFSTKPLKRCQDNSIENPLAEPPRISGSFVKYTKEATRDRHGNPLQNSSYEMLRGKTVEFDDNRPTVNISINTSYLPLGLFAPMVDTVNDGYLWGLQPRRIKLSNATWERLLWGTCTYYYTLNYSFDINDGPNGFDRKVPDEGTKVLIPGGTPGNPRHYKAYKDILQENSRVFLKDGRPLPEGEDPVDIDIEYYTESNFLALGIPTNF